MEKLLTNKVAIVTGAGAGIGKATSILFASEGAVVYALDIKGMQWVSEEGYDTNQIIPVELDICDFAAVKQQIETIKENERKRIEEEKRREAARKAAEEAAKKAAEEAAKKAAEEARKAAEEAARKAAEEEAKRAAEAAAAANQPTTTTANNVTVADQPATTAATTQPVTVAADPAPVSTGTKASIRAAIANEAPKYLGLKYVWGGTSLSTGADCSGFCWAIYKKCGVDISGLQRTSYGMASQSLGRTVSVSEAQPGDLVFYGDSYGNVNHVAIYIGNNTIIHESGYQVGCKKSSIYYRNIIKIKNFIDYL
jgi:cell wall-associated NlpC family hydrolase